MRELAPPKGKALIYIYQRQQDGNDISPLIWLNNTRIGRTVPGGFTVWKLSPGQLTVRVGGKQTASVSIRSVAGKTYRFRVSVAQTVTGPSASIELMSASERADMMQTRWIKNPLVSKSKSLSFWKWWLTDALKEAWELTFRTQN